MMKYIYQDIHIALTDERFRLLHFCRLKLYRTYSLIMAILPFSKDYTNNNFRFEFEIL